MTREELGITHILEVSPRGFHNEVSVLPITHEYLRLAEERADRAENDVNSWGALYAWDDAPAKLRKRVGLMIVGELTYPADMGGIAVKPARMLGHLLDEAFSPGFGPYQYLNGQWVPATEAAAV